MPLRHPTVRNLAWLAALSAGLAGCMSTNRSAMQSVPAGSADSTVQLAEVKDAIDKVAPAPVAMAQKQTPQITGLGFAQIAGQPGKTGNEKRLMAIRAARMDALRDLTEQIHGIRIDAETTVRDAVVQDDRLYAVVEGTIRGARTVRITPKDPDAYEIVMAIDRDTVGYILRAVRGGL